MMAAAMTSVDFIRVCFGKRAQRTNHVQICAFILALEDKLPP